VTVIEVCARTPLAARRVVNNLEGAVRDNHGLGVWREPAWDILESSAGT
jgi:hypothetical protein